MTTSIRTCLWFDGNGEDAARFYVTLFPDSEITSTFQADPGAPPLVVNFTLAGVPYQALNGGTHYELSPAVSISVTTRDQEETDELWNAFLQGGGSELQCGWLTDRFGLSWQIVPEALPRLLGDTDREAASRAMQAMLKMQKIDIAALEAAFRGETADT